MDKIMRELPGNIIDSECFDAWVKNDALGVGEKIARIGSTKRASLLREAIVKFDSNSVNLGCIDDFGEHISLKKLKYKDVNVIKHKKSVVTRSHQMLQPIMSGIFFGGGLGVYLFFTSKGEPDYGTLLLATFAAMIFISIIMIISNSKNISSGDLAVICIESNDDNNLEFMVEDEGVNSLLNFTREKNIKDIAL